MHGSRGETYTILKDGAGKLWLYGIEVGNYNYVAQVDGHYYQLNAPEIERATAFAVHPVITICIMRLITKYIAITLIRKHVVYYPSRWRVAKLLISFQESK